MAAILVIDDNDTIRDGLAHIIKKMGHSVATAASSSPALARATPGSLGARAAASRRNAWCRPRRSAAANSIGRFDDRRHALILGATCSGAR